MSVEPLYVDKQAFGYNHREDAQGNKTNEEDRFSSLCSQIVGRRLTYKELTGKEAQK